VITRSGFSGQKRWGLKKYPGSVLSKKSNEYIKAAEGKYGSEYQPEPIKVSKVEKLKEKPGKFWQKGKFDSFKFRQIGVISTPYKDNAPYQPVSEDEGDFYITVYPGYVDGLSGLTKFRYIYVLYYINRIKEKLSMTVSPPWTGGLNTGVFASRSPVRPNPIGLSVVNIKKIVNNRIFTSGLDVFDKTPLLDIKPYVKDLDSKPDANYGWIGEIDDSEHLLLHIKGIPHDY